MDKAVLVAHYDKELEWLDNISNDIEIIIYTANDLVPDTWHHVKNRGNDSSHYLTFIIENYDNLPKQTVFCHDHRTNWTQEFRTDEIINRLNWDIAKYFSIGARCNYWTCIPYQEKPYHIQAMKRNWKLLADYLPYPEKLTYIAGTQFCVHKDLILQYPKSFYEDCRQWVYTTNEAEWFIGRFFEYTWHYIFTKDPIEKDLKYMI